MTFLSTLIVLIRGKLSPFCERYELHSIGDVSDGQYRLITVNGIGKKEHGILANILCKAIRLIWITGFLTKYPTSVYQYNQAVSKCALIVLSRFSSSLWILRNAIP